MKYLIVGLGNPGIKYLNNRHNIGFQILDQIAIDFNENFDSNRYADIAEIRFKGRTINLVKPNTYMNLSGKAVNYWINKCQLELSQLLVVSDDIALPFGNLRIRKKGSDGGHNGLKNINLILSSSNYSRLRFGVGNNFNKGGQVNYVLSDFNHEEQLVLPEKIQEAINIVKSFTTIGIDRTMNIHNSK